MEFQTKRRQIKEEYLIHLSTLHFHEYLKPLNKSHVQFLRDKKYKKKLAKSYASKTDFCYTCTSHTVRFIYLCYSLVSCHWVHIFSLTHKLFLAKESHYQSYMYPAHPHYHFLNIHNIFVLLQKPTPCFLSATQFLTYYASYIIFSLSLLAKE
jgi:hypothetical protein